MSKYLVSKIKSNISEEELDILKKEHKLTAYIQMAKGFGHTRKLSRRVSEALIHEIVEQDGDTLLCSALPEYY